MAALVSLGSRFYLLFSNGIPTSRFDQPPFAIRRRYHYISRAQPRQSKDFTVVRKICLALVLMAMASVASAREDHLDKDKCFHFLWWSFCPPTDRDNPHPVKAPEIDPASAMAGLTMLAGGLAVLRGRRKINPKD
jgi:hypothetical protein